MSNQQIISSSCQALPSREQALFKKLIKCYEQKQYKVGLRCAKQIMSNPIYAEHGETLAMKGLILNCMGKHEEAQEIVRKGLTADLKSHICWHVFGLTQRTDKKYDEAMKAYKMALRIEPENMQILRDLSVLQVQMRDFEGYRDSRYKLLELRPSNKMGWIGYASAYHLQGEYAMALGIIKEFKKNNKPTSNVDYENSEILLYEVMVLTEAGRIEDALNKLEENSSCIIDRLAYLEHRGSLLVKLGRFEDAERAYHTLLDRNQDCVQYYKQIEKCHQLDEVNDRPKLAALYESIIEKRPKAPIPKMLHLNYLSGSAFESKMFAFLIECLRRGIPSLFKNLVLLYSDSQKVSVIERILLEFVRKFEENGYNRFSLDGSNLPECPTTVLWVYYYLAQHFDWLKNYQRAHKYIDEALKHTPTLIELYLTKAKIYKHSKETAKAAELMVQAQELDTADRYVNSKCAKYLLRAGHVQQAEEMCAKFTREGTNVVESLTEMQCMWFELECARAFANLRQYGEALRKCHQIERHFVNFFEDQYDFHNYCLRKMSLSSYVRFLRFEDFLYVQKFYVNASKLAASIYLDMIETPQKFTDKVTEEEGNISAAEMKKMRRKANKVKAVEEKAKQNGQIQGKQKRRTDGELDVIEPEPLDPKKLAKPKNPLDEATKFIRPILQMPCKDVDLWVVAFRVYFHKNKLLVMLQCLNKIFTLDPSNENTKKLFGKYMEKYKTASGDRATDQLVKELTRSFSARIGFIADSEIDR
ncbi:hypothetical protein niasHS_007527 [Heterodera schachtii]|uniref:Uncharacterized protein n=1 Tax=Heterodera schachtii TaxID=97005 RepID=A0ABD2JXY5_HETSC